MTDESKEKQSLFGLLVSIVKSKRDAEWNFSYWETRYLYLCNAVLRCSLDNEEGECAKCRKNFEPKIKKILKIDKLHEEEGIVKKKILEELVDKIEAVEEEVCLYSTLQELDELLIEITNFQVTFKAWATNVKINKDNRKKRGSSTIYTPTTEEKQVEKMLVNQYTIATNQVQDILNKIKTDYDASVLNETESEGKDDVSESPPGPSKNTRSKKKKISLFKIFALISTGLLMLNACPVGASNVVSIQTKTNALEPLNQSFLQTRYDPNSKKLTWTNGDQFIEFKKVDKEGNQIDGFGTFTNDKTIYKGDFIKNKPHGKGKLSVEGQIVYDGDWVEGEATGWGTIFKDGKRLYKGYVVKGVPDCEEGGAGDKGKVGRQYAKDGTTRYEGFWKDGKWAGLGTLNFESGNEAQSFLDPACKLHGLLPEPWKFYSNTAPKYSGNFSKGQFHDIKGKLTINVVNYVGWNKYKTMEYNGNWKNGKMVGEGNWRSLNGTKWRRQNDGKLMILFKTIKGLLGFTELHEFEITESNGVYSGNRNKLSDNKKSTYLWQKGQWSFEQIDDGNQELVENGEFKIYREDGKTVDAEGNMTNGKRTGKWTIHDQEFQKTDYYDEKGNKIKSYTALYNANGERIQVWNYPVGDGKVYSGFVQKVTRGRIEPFNFGQIVKREENGEISETSSAFYDAKGKNEENAVYWSTICEGQRVYPSNLEIGQTYSRYDIQNRIYTTVLIDESGNEVQATEYRPIFQHPPPELGEADRSRIAFFEKELRLPNGEKWVGLVDEQNRPGIWGTLYHPIGFKIYEGEAAVGFSNKVVKQGCGTEYTTDNSGTYVSACGHYRNNELHGDAEKYGPQGNIVASGNFKNGKEDGEFREFDDQGRLVLVAKYENGIRNGPFAKYDGNASEPIAWGEMLNGEMTGNGVLYQKDFGYIDANWSKGEINDNYDYFIYRTTVINSVPSSPIQGDLQGDTKNGYSFVDAKPYMVVSNRSFSVDPPQETIFSYNHSQYDSFFGEHGTSINYPYNNNIFGTNDTSISIRDFSSLNLPSGEGFIYWDGLFYSFYRDDGSLDEELVTSLWSRVSTLIPRPTPHNLAIVTFGSIIVKAMILSFRRWNRNPLPALEPSYFAQYLAKSAIAQKHQFYVQYARSLEI